MSNHAHAQTLAEDPEPEEWLDPDVWLARRGSSRDAGWDVDDRDRDQEWWDGWDGADEGDWLDELSGGHGDGGAGHAPWYLGDALAVADGTAELEVQDWEAEILAIPFVRRCRALLEYVGEGRRLTDRGTLPVARIRELRGILGVSRPGTTLREVPEIRECWNALIQMGVLTIADDWVRRSEDPHGHWTLDRSSEDLSAGAVAALGWLLALKTCVCPEHGGFEGEWCLLETLLATTAPGGLMLPRLPEDGELGELEVAELFAAIGASPQITRLPVDEEAGCVDLAALSELATVQRDLDLLVDAGVLERRGASIIGSPALGAAVALHLILRDRALPQCASPGCRRRVRER
ncbi:hypothetical protein DEO23_00840 [Brachybacterium endophyticum]|uniref:Uncharacterized protein n=1 Tax=Brachybacterium endophyticum TaxID=2182385 RepID=A0A2U2RMX5_9MICO|nr:hypothetical protein [Brachybacterium endophyticum]PWH07237.1 hypothetical protein DEO23_00840 [Brachybacterium endophyticum]